MKHLANSALNQLVINQKRIRNLRDPMIQMYLDDRHWKPSRVFFFQWLREQYPGLSRIFEESLYLLYFAAQFDHSIRHRYLTDYLKTFELIHISKTQNFRFLKYQNYYPQAFEQLIAELPGKKGYYRFNPVAWTAIQRYLWAKVQGISPKT